MKIKITSDGTPYGTRLTAEDGGEIEGAVAVTWRASANDPMARAEVELDFIELNGIAEARMIGPGGKEVRRIEYADGSVDEFPVTAEGDAA